MGEHGHDAPPPPAEGAVCHVEIAADDVARLREFYGSCFGWTFQHVPELDYTLFRTGAGGIGGGIMKRKPDMPRQHVNYVSVADADAVVAKVRAAGGTVHVAPTDIPGVGRYSVLADPEGNVFGIWQSAGR